jgi:hypothetical protein
MRSSFRTTLLCAAAAALVLGSTASASADDVDLTSSTPTWTVGTDGVPTITLNVGESGSVVVTYVETDPEHLSSGGGKPVMGPGLPGCELKGAKGLDPKDTQLVLRVDDETDGIIALGAQTVTFADCPGTTDGVTVPETRTLTFTGSAAGQTLVSFDVDAATVALDGAYFTAPDTFRVVVLAPADGRDAPAIANDYLHNTADAATLAACQVTNGTNANQGNWQGQLINKIAQFFDGQTFTPEEEYVVVDKVLEFCGVGSTSS